MPLQGLLPLTDRCDLLLKIRHGQPLCRRHGPRIRYAAIFSLARVKLRSRWFTAYARCRPRRSTPALQIEFPAQPHELPKHRPERCRLSRRKSAIVLKSASAGVAARSLEVAMRLCRQPAARPNTIQIPVDIQLQQIRGIVASDGPCRWAERAGIQPPRSRPSTNASMKRTGFPVPRSRPQYRPPKQKLGTVFTGDMCHDTFYHPPWGDARSPTPARLRRLFTQSGAVVQHSSIR